VPERGLEVAGAGLVVEERPEHGVREPLVEALDLVAGQEHRHQIVAALAEAGGEDLLPVAARREGEPRPADPQTPPLRDATDRRGGRGPGPGQRPAPRTRSATPTLRRSARRRPAGGWRPPGDGGSRGSRSSSCGIQLAYRDIACIPPAMSHRRNVPVRAHLPAILRVPTAAATPSAAAPPPPFSSSSSQPFPRPPARSASARSPRPGGSTSATTTAARGSTTWSRPWAAGWCSSITTATATWTSSSSIAGAS